MYTKEDIPNTEIKSYSCLTASRLSVEGLGKCSIFCVAEVQCFNIPHYVFHTTIINSESSLNSKSCFP